MRLSDPAERAVLEDRALERGKHLRVVLCRFVLTVAGDGYGDGRGGDGGRGDGSGDVGEGRGDGGYGAGYGDGGYGFGDGEGEHWI